MSFFLDFFFFNATATTEIYTLFLHDALPISLPDGGPAGARPARTRPPQRRHHPAQDHGPQRRGRAAAARLATPGLADRKSTRLNSSHSQISYAVFCLKKKKNKYYNVKPHNNE